MLFLFEYIFILASEYILYVIGLNDYGRMLNKITMRLVKHNILFIKMFQYLSSFTDTFSKPLLDSFNTYTNNATIFDDEIDTDTLMYVLDKYDIEIESQTPYRAGMIAVVYKGRFKNKNEKDELKSNVIIKIKKKNVDENIFKGCKYLQSMYKFCGMFVKKDDEVLNLLQPFVDNFDNLKLQYDFEREIKTLKQAQAELPDFLADKIHIPKVFNDNKDSVECPKFILMEYIDGEHFNESNSYTKEDLYQYAKHIFLYIIHCSMIGGQVIHMDLHSGNLIFDKINKNVVSIIDYGMSEVLSVKESSSLFKLILICADKLRNGINISEKYDVVSLFESLFDDGFMLSTYLSKPKRNELNSILSVFVANILSSTTTLDEKFMYDLLKNVSRIVGKRLKFSRAIYNSILGLAICNKLILRLLDHDLQQLSQLTQECVLFFVEE